MCVNLAQLACQVLRQHRLQPRLHDGVVWSEVGLGQVAAQPRQRPNLQYRTQLYCYSSAQQSRTESLASWFATACLLFSSTSTSLSSSV